MVRVAVITASSTGIGHAVARSLLPNFHVVISSRSASNVESALESLPDSPYGASGCVCHVGNPEHRLALLKHARSKGEIAALVLNAAVSTAYGPLLKTSEIEWDKMFDINVKANFMMCKLFVPHIQQGGCIVFMSSISAYTALPGLGAYAITKTALLQLVKVLSIELARKRIRVNGVAPGLIKTNFSKPLWKETVDKNGKKVDSMADRAMKHDASGRMFHIPMGRLGVPHEVAQVVKFLVCDAEYVTGETVVVAGGAHSKL